MSCAWPYLLLLTPAAVLVGEDLGTRRVSVVWLALLGASAVSTSWHVVGWQTMLRQAAVNTCSLLVVAALLGVYLSLRRFAVRYSVGAGDLVCLVAITPLFGAQEFIRFLIAACLVSLGWWVVCRKRRRTVPFVAMIGITLTGWVLFQLFRL